MSGPRHQILFLFHTFFGNFSLFSPVFQHWESTYGYFCTAQSQSIYFFFSIEALPDHRSLGGHGKGQMSFSTLIWLGLILALTVQFFLDSCEWALGIELTMYQSKSGCKSDVLPKNIWPIHPGVSHVLGAIWEITLVSLSYSQKKL